MAQFSPAKLDALVQKARQGFAASWATPVSQVQRITTRDRGVRGPCWVSRTVFPAHVAGAVNVGETDEEKSNDNHEVLALLLAVIKHVGNGNEKYDIPNIESVPVQWVGHRPGVDKREPEPHGMTEHEKFDALTAQCSSDLTVMYMYGGAHYSNSPATRRTTATTLSQLTGGRCVIVQPRLAPQNAFPCQILDALMAYLSLLYPPPGAFHSPVNPGKLVLAGDSSGAQLAINIAQIVLAARQIQHSEEATISFHGRRVPLPLPAGIAAQSPAWGGALPSWTDNESTDITPRHIPFSSPGFPSDEIWPTKPPREHIHTLLCALPNPLANPMTNTDWNGSPPIYVGVGGGEMMLDMAKVVAQTAARQGVRVIWDEYERMPHNFPMYLGDWPQSTRCMQEWAAACVQFARGGPAETNGIIFPLRLSASGKRELQKVDVRELTHLTEQDVKNGLAEAIADMERNGQHMMKKWTNELGKL